MAFLIHENTEKGREDNRRERQHRDHPPCSRGRDVETRNQNRTCEFLKGDNAAIEKHAEKCQKPEIAIPEDLPDICDAEGSLVRFLLDHFTVVPCINSDENRPEDEADKH